MLKISVLIVAHNEEKNIRKCIESLKYQTILPSEIVVVAHNCTDTTEDIIREFTEVKLISYQGSRGVTFARIEGFKHVEGEIIACIDGDSYAEKNWLKEITRPFYNQDIAGVGTVVVYTGSLFSRLVSFKHFYMISFLNVILGKYGKFYFFGPSFAVRKNDYKLSGGFEPFIELRKKLHLKNWPDDCYLSLVLLRKGKVVLVRKKQTRVFAKAKNLGLYGIFIRPFEQMIDGKKLFDYFKNE